MVTIAHLMQSYVAQEALHTLEGTYQTAIPDVRFYRSASGAPRQPLTYFSGILMMGQGTKEIYLGSQHIRYHAGTYLVVGVPLPLECEAISEQGKPLLSLCIDIAPARLQRLVNTLHRQGVTQQIPEDHYAICSDTLPLPLEEAFVRLLNALLNPLDADVLGNSIVDEIVYRVLMERKGYILYQLASHEGHYGRVAKALLKMHEDYSLSPNIEDLASSVNMSVSSFHRAFRSVTADSPLRYLKKIKLNKAKDLIALEGKKINEAALMVGYTSPSQFSREYKRHFNETPKEHARM